MLHWLPGNHTATTPLQEVTVLGEPHILCRTGSKLFYLISIFYYD